MKYYLNDQEVTEDVYLKVMEDHKQWAEDQYKKQQAELVQAEKESKRKKK